MKDRNIQKDQENLNAHLRELFAEGLEGAIKREKTTFDELASPFGDSIVLFGAGGLGRKTLAGLREVGIVPLAFADNNPQLWNTRVDNIEVLSPDEAARRFGDRAVFVVTIWRAGGGHRYQQTRQQLLSLKCNKVTSFVPLYWKYHESFLPFYSINLPHNLYSQLSDIFNAFQLWSDIASREEYVSQLKFRLYADFEALSSPVQHPQYLADDLYKLSKDEVIIDCGAYDGDTIRALLQRYPDFLGRIYAFEPDPKNFEKLHQYVDTLDAAARGRITIYPIAAGERRETVRFAATGTDASTIDSSGAVEINCVRLDDTIVDNDSMFIKMDIEGGEMNALYGARRLIQANMPILAISAYHHIDHLWRIPLLIRSFSDSYRFFLRPHNEEDWDLVCYAVPVDRLLPSRRTKESAASPMREKSHFIENPKRICPICKKTNARLLFRQAFSQLSKGSLLNGYDVVICETCGFGFADHIPAQSSFDEYYQNMSKYEYQDSGGQETPYDLSRFQKIFNIVRTFLPNQDTRILDVGCATGRLLSLFKDNGYYNVQGLDPSPLCAATARKLYNVHVQTLNPSELVKSNQLFECIILSGVLEHICDLASTLSTLRLLTAEDGKIFIEVPDATEFAHWPDAPFQEFSIEHINFFSQISLTNLLRRYGFKEIFSAKGIRNQTSTTVMPVVSAVYQKITESISENSIFDYETERGLRDYINQSQKVEDRIHKIIEELILKAVPIVVWGAGTHTLRLLATSRLAKANIRAFIDSNPRYQGKHLNGIEIISPHDLRERDEAIMISSRVFQNDIEKQIRQDLCLTNDIIKFYED